MELQAVYERILNRDEDFFKNMTEGTLWQLRRQAGATVSYALKNNKEFSRFVFLFLWSISFYVFTHLLVKYSIEIQPIWHIPLLVGIIAISLLIALILSSVFIVLFENTVEVWEGHPNAVLQALLPMDKDDFNEETLETLDSHPKAREYIYHFLGLGRKKILNIDVHIIDSICKSDKV